MYCDDKGPTIVLIQTEKGRKFGGYAHVSWSKNSPGIYKKDASSFLFSLDKRLIFPVKNPEKAINCDYYKGPSFGACCFKLMAPGYGG